MLGEFPVYDPQAIRDPRPDFAGYAQSRALIFPVTPVASTGQTGAVNIFATFEVAGVESTTSVGSVNIQIT